MRCENDNKVILYLMRHGQTIINKAERVQGWCDGILTEEGIEVAKNVAVGLSDIEFKAVYSSDLGRAVKTARIVVAANRTSSNLKVKEVEELREAYFGKYEGEMESVMAIDMLKYLKMNSFEEAMKIPDFYKVYADTCAAIDETGMAENYDTLIKRVKKAIVDISKEVSSQGGGNVLIVAHGGMLMTLLKTLDISLNIGIIENSSISKVEYNNGEFKVLSVNDLSYKERGEKLIKC